MFENEAAIIRVNMCILGMNEKRENKELMSWRKQYRSLVKIISHGKMHGLNDQMIKD